MEQLPWTELVKYEDAGSLKSETRVDRENESHLPGNPTNSLLKNPVFLVLGSEFQVMTAL